MLIDHDLSDLCICPRSETNVHPVPWHDSCSSDFAQFGGCSNHTTTRYIREGIVRCVLALMYCCTVISHVGRIFVVSYCCECSSFGVFLLLFTDVDVFFCSAILPIFVAFFMLLYFFCFYFLPLVFSFFCFAIYQCCVFCWCYIY